jgi:hypothetical protein
MEIVEGIDQLGTCFQNPVVTLGNFDGVHLIIKRFSPDHEVPRIMGRQLSLPSPSPFGSFPCVVPFLRLER